MKLSFAKNILLFISMSGLIAGCGGERSTATAEQFFSAIEAEDSRRAAELVSTADEVRDPHDEAFDFMKKEVRSRGKSFELLDERVEGDFAAVMVKSTSESVGTDVKPFYLTKEDGSWRMLLRASANRLVAQDVVPISLFEWADAKEDELNE
jgi:hypothetical protein